MPSETGYKTTLIWLVAATFTVILNETIMMNAIPRLMDEFDVSARDAQWLSTAFMLAMAVVIPITGWFLQRVPTRRVFLSAMTIFVTGTLLAALAWSFPVLIGARIIQACGTAIMMPLLMTTLMTIVPEQERGKVMGNVTLAMSVAPALGPTISGFVLEIAAWRWIFWLVLPIAVLVTLGGMRYLSNVGQHHEESLDWLSVILAAVGFGTLVYGLSQIGGEKGAALIDPWLAIAIGAAGIVAFVSRQLLRSRGGKTPLLDLATLQHRSYTLALTLMAAAFMAMLGVMLLLPLYLQDVRGLSTLKTGLMLMPGGLAMGLLGPKVGALYDSYGARVLVIPGAICVTLALLVFSQVTPHTPYIVILLAYTALLISLAFVFTPVFTVGLGALPPQLYSHGSSLLGTVQQLAAATGSALVVTVMSSRAATLARQGEAAGDALAGGMRWAFALAAGISVVVILVALVMPGRSAAAVHGAAATEPEIEPDVEPVEPA